MQDRELNAGTRWPQRLGGQLIAWRTPVLGDDLYCHQPFCEQSWRSGKNSFCPLGASSSCMRAVAQFWLLDFMREALEPEQPPPARRTAAWGS